MAKCKYGQMFKESLLKGIAWSFGVTIGFVFISTVVVFIFKQAGGLPLIGNFVASIVEATQEQLVKRTPLFPQ
jgi:hypothetical protein